MNGRMLKEYDVVTARRDLNEKVAKGARGTVLIVYEANPPKYEVEFLDEDGYTIDLLTLSDNEVTKER